MLILTNKNLKKYLNNTKKNLPFSFTGVLSIEEITEETYVNWIFRVKFKTKTGNLVIYLRQSRDFVKKKPEYKMPAERIAYEEKILGLLGQIVPGVVPEVIYFDAKNNVLWLADIKQGCPLLVKELIAGRAHTEAAVYFGRILATIHGQTLGIKNKAVRGSAKLNKAAIDFHLGMRLAPALKMLPKETKKFLRSSLAAPRSLVLGDLASKNIFIDSDKIRFLDLERSFVGDGAFDAAFLFCHFLLELPQSQVESALKFINLFLKSYQRELEKYLGKNKASAQIMRVHKFTGITILYRLFGFYLVTGINPNKEKWTEVAKKLMAGRITLSKITPKMVR